MTIHQRGWVEIKNRFHPFPTSWNAAVDISAIVGSRRHQSLLIEWGFEPTKLEFDTSDLPPDISWAVRYELEDLGLQLGGLSVQLWRDVKPIILHRLDVIATDQQILVAMIGSLTQLYDEENIRIITWTAVPMGEEERLHEIRRSD